MQRRKRRGPHRRRRILLHIDGSTHRWLNDDRWCDLMVILDDATSEIYYAQLVQQESTRTVMAALRAIIKQKGMFCALYSDRASHFFLTPQAGEPVDKYRLTQVGRALKELGIQMTFALQSQIWQLDQTRWRHSLAGCTVTIHEHLDGTISARYGPHAAGRYNSNGDPLAKPERRRKGGAMEAVENQKQFPQLPRLRGLIPKPKSQNRGTRLLDETRQITC